jgi:hypothetical protein
MLSAANSGTRQVVDVQSWVQAAVDDMVASGAETGLMVAVLTGGQLVADAVGGVADPQTGT